MLFVRSKVEFKEQFIEELELYCSDEDLGTDNIYVLIEESNYETTVWAPNELIINFVLCKEYISDEEFYSLVDVYLLFMKNNQATIVTYHGNLSFECEEVNKTNEGISSSELLCNSNLLTLKQTFQSIDFHLALSSNKYFNTFRALKKSYLALQTSLESIAVNGDFTSKAELIVAGKYSDASTINFKEIRLIIIMLRSAVEDSSNYSNAIPNIYKKIIESLAVSQKLAVSNIEDEYEANKVGEGANYWLSACLFSLSKFTGVNNNNYISYLYAFRSFESFVNGVLLNRGFLEYKFSGKKGATLYLNNKFESGFGKKWGCFQTEVKRLTGKKHDKLLDKIDCYLKVRNNNILVHSVGLVNSTMVNEFQSLIYKLMIELDAHINIKVNIWKVFSSSVESALKVDIVNAVKGDFLDVMGFREKLYKS